jgi:hypothetical protein
MLPTSGTIKMSQINTEFGRAWNTRISIKDARDGVYGVINLNSNPNPITGNNPITGQPKTGMRLSDWYGYNHNAIVGLSFQLIETTSQGWANTCPVAWTNPITKYTKTGLKSGGGVNFDDIYKIYNDVGCTSVFQIVSKTFKALENGVYKRISGHSHSDTIEVLEDCSAPASYYAYNFSASRTSSSQSCLLTTYGTTWYSASVQLDMGARLFSNTVLTTPISGGNLWFHCQTGMAYQVDNSGYIIAYYDCGGI